MTHQRQERWHALRYSEGRGPRQEHALRSTSGRATRAAFTLIELIVVITLILVLAGMGVLFLPSIGESARAAQGGTMLQQWVLTAKQKALRDQVPCGIRLVPYRDPVTGAMDYANIRECQFIELPDDFGVGPSTTKGNLSGTVGLTFVDIDMQLTDQIAAGDYLEVLGGGEPHRITAITHNGASTKLSLANALPYTIHATKGYRIIRAARVTGDDVLQLPDSVVIDVSTNVSYTDPNGNVHLNLNPLPFANADKSIDILFAPTGEVISRGTTTDSINLWVRDINDPPSGTNSEQTILAIYARSGLTAAHPPAPGADPYAFVKDGRTSGK
jgi:prepilin-type N-terminal cleavage/methylation domain-containing protein